MIDFFCLQFNGFTILQKCLFLNEVGTFAFFSTRKPIRFTKPHATIH
jgi:hypothetical protein